MVRADDSDDMGFHSFTQDGCQDLVGDVKETDTSVVLTFFLISFFVDCANYALVPILGHRFFTPDFCQQSSAEMPSEPALLLFFSLLRAN